MTIVLEGTELEFGMDGYLKSNMDIAKREALNDWDMIFGVDGYEGVGKSAFAQQCAAVCDPPKEMCRCDWKKPADHAGLCIKRITFNPKDFKKTVMEAKMYQAIIYDEAFGGLSSRGAMTQINRSIVQMLQVIRKKRLFIFIVAPSFFELDKYVAIHRSRALLHAYSPGNFQRGYFKFYDKESKKRIYLLGKKGYDYSVSNPGFIGRFPNRWMVDKDQYEAKKSATSIEPEPANGMSIRQKARDLKMHVARAIKRKGLRLTNSQIASIVGVSRQTIQTYLAKEEAEEAEKEGYDVYKALGIDENDEVSP